MTSSEPILQAKSLTRVFGSAGGAVTALNDVNLELHEGEMIVVRGRSGAGKTTLLNLLGGLDRPTSGSVLLGDLDISKAPEARLVDTRRDDFGFVFQDFGLIPVLSAAENIEVPLRLAGIAPTDRDSRVAELLELVGLSRNSAQRPGELSGGQQQRVGIARALARRPRVLLADEPTGQLDSATAITMMELFDEVVRSQGVSAILTSHDAALMSRADRILELRDGQLTHGRHRLDEQPAS
ncbi:MAG TPA: ABC transporter ATP-binding protein [Galbitalea sp.]|jgi:putative ABC transport system ATP-binding protein|nr:ABC transporter ATP-binding protein [Galbitalea sp.]